MKKILNSLFIYPDDIPLLAFADVRRRKIINTMLAGMSSTVILLLIILYSLYFVLPEKITKEDLSTISTGCLIALAGCALVAFLNRRVSSRAVGILFLLIIYVVIISADSPFEITLGRSLIFVAVPVIMAAILFPPWGGVLVAVLNSVIISYVDIVYELGAPNLPAIWVLFFIALLLWRSTSISKQALGQLQASNHLLLEAQEHARQINIELEQRVVERTAELQTTNDRLRASEARYRAVVEDQTELLCRFLPDTTLTFVNEAYCRYFGKTQEELIGMSFLQVIPEKDWDNIRQHINSLTEKNTQIQYEHQVLGSNGEMLWQQWVDRAIRNSEGQVIEFQSVGRDITERKRAEEALKKSEERLQGYSAGNFVGIYLTGLDNPIDVTLPVETQIDLIYENAYMAECNQALAKMYNLPSSEPMIGMRLIDAHGGKDGVVNRDVFRRWIENGYKSFDDETLEYTPDGKPLWFLSNTIGIIENGYLVRTWGTAIAITERKQMEEALKESEWRHRVVSDLTADSIFVADVDPDRTLKIRWVSGGMFRIIEKTIEEIGTSDLWETLVYPADRMSFFDFMSKTLSTTEPGEMECRVFHKQGGIKWVRIYAQPQINEDNRITAIVGALKDITERKLAEVALRESEARYRAVVEDQTELICRFHPDHTLTFVNDAYCRYFGREREELIGHSFMSLVPVEEHPIVLKTISALRPGNEVMTYEHQVLLASGELRWQQWTNRVIFDETGQALEFQSVGRDVTERRRMEELIRENRERFRTTFRSSPIGMAIIKLDDEKILEANSAFFKIFGYAQKDVIGHTAVELNIWPNPEERHRLLQKLRIHGRVYEFEAKLRRKSGEIGDQLVSMEMMEVNGEKCMIGWVLDITERKRAEESLRKSETFIRNVNNNLVSGMVYQIFRMKDGSRKFTYLTDAVQTMYGITPQQGLENPEMLYGRIYDEDRSRVRQEEEEAYRTLSIFKTEARVVNPDGSLRWSSFISNPRVLEDETTCWDGIELDITDRKRAEESLREMNQHLEIRVAERTSELRESREHMQYLARQVINAQEEERKRIADELHDEAGQLLIGLRSPLNMIYNELPAKMDTHRQMIDKAMKLADEVARRIRAMSYSLHPQTLELMGIEMAIKGHCKEFSENTGVQVFCNFENTDLEAAPNEIKLSIYRLVWEALANVRKHAGATRVDVSLAYADGFISVSVSDNGRGMDSESKDNYGIGLRGVMERIGILDGHLKIESESGKGVRIQALLPWSKD